MNYLYDFIKKDSVKNINSTTDNQNTSENLALESDSELLILKLRTENLELKQMVKKLLTIIEENEIDLSQKTQNEDT